MMRRWEKQGCTRIAVITLPRRVIAPPTIAIEQPRGGIGRRTSQIAWPARATRTQSVEARRDHVLRAAVLREAQPRLGTPLNSQGDQLFRATLVVRGRDDGAGDALLGARQL